MKTKLTITNKSKFPTSYVKILANFVFDTIGRDKFLYHSYNLTLYNHNRSWCGRGGINYQRTRLYRHYGRERGFWPHDVKDARFKWSVSHILNDRTEILVYLFAHEAGHSIYSNRRKNGTCSNEFQCNELGMNVVRAYRANKKELWIKIKEQLRKEHQIQKEIKPAKAPEIKLLKAENKLNEWSRKLKKCQNKIKTYQRKVKYYSMKMAARKS
jgi:hypothetical protein